MFLRRNRLLVQIRTFIRYRPQTIIVNDEDIYVLNNFAKFLDKRDVSEITIQDVEKYQEHLLLVYSLYQTRVRMNLINCFMRYYNFHRNMPKRPARNPLQVDKVIRVKTLIDEGRTIREVGEKEHMNISQVHRYYHTRLPANNGYIKPRKR